MIENLKMYANANTIIYLQGLIIIMLFIHMIMIYKTNNKVKQLFKIIEIASLEDKPKDNITPDVVYQEIKEPIPPLELLDKMNKEKPKRIRKPKAKAEIKPLNENNKRIVQKAKKLKDKVKK